MIIDIEKLCPKCRLDHEATEKSRGQKLDIEPAELCRDCKKTLGLTRAKGADTMKRGRKKGAKKTGKTPRLDRETRGFIKDLGKRVKRAAKFQAKAEKLQTRADEYKAEAYALRAGIEALNRALKDFI